jgi:hypothetical protein
MGVSILSFMLLDIVKVLIIRNWSFELTAVLWPSKSNREKLKKRQARASLLERFKSNVDKVKKAVVITKAASAFRSSIIGRYYAKAVSRVQSKSFTPKVLSLEEVSNKPSKIQTAEMEEISPEESSSGSP